MEVQDLSSDMPQEPFGSGSLFWRDRTTHSASQPGGRYISTWATGNLPLAQSLLYIALNGTVPVAEA